MSDLSGLSNLRGVLFPVCGFIIGAVAWSGHVYALPALAFVPLLLRFAKGRAQFLGAVAAYNAGATWTLVPGASIFYGHTFNALNILLLWTVVLAILTLPWLIIRPFGPLELRWGLPIAMLVIAFLPTGIANPVTAAGALFPGTSWLGILLTAILFSAVAIRPIPSLFVIASISLVCNISFPTAPAAPMGWQAFNTRFGGSGLEDGDYKRAFTDALKIQHLAIDSTASVVVFPEAIVKTWTPVTDLFWQDTFDILRGQGKTIIIGAEMPLNDNGLYANTLVVRGSQRSLYRQRIPLPYAMWKPWAKDGVPINYAGSPTMLIRGQRIAPIICYEQLLVSPVLISMAKNPTILVGVANDYWARGTSIPAIQSSALSAWSRLFQVPAVTAVNE